MLVSKSIATNSLSTKFNSLDNKLHNLLTPAIIINAIFKHLLLSNPRRCKSFNKITNGNDIHIDLDFIVSIIIKVIKNNSKLVRCCNRK